MTTETEKKDTKLSDLNVSITKISQNVSKLYDERKSLNLMSLAMSNDLDNIKRYCTHLLRKKFDQDIFMASLLNRLIELEANRVVAEMRKEKKKPVNPIKKFFRIP